MTGRVEERTVEPREGVEARALHPYSYRSGEWGRIQQVLEVADAPTLWCVVFEHGDVDWWRADDPAAEYELRERP